MSQGFIRPDADYQSLNETLWIEKIEHLLTICAMYLAKKPLSEVAPWTNKDKNAKNIISEMKKWQQQKK